MTLPFRFATVGILLAAALLFGLRLGDRDVVSEELRFAEVAREMASTRDYFHPTINGNSYYDKPLGSYWLIVAASKLTGGVDETAARLPAAIAGWLGVLLVMFLARRLYDDRTALWAGAILATCFSFAFYARRATADIETVTGTLAAVTLFAYCRERTSTAWVLGLWLLMGLTSLTKGLLGFALPIVVLGTFGLWSTLAERTTLRARPARYFAHNRWFFNRWTAFALPLGFTVFLLPYILSGWQSGFGDGLVMVYRENVKRFFQPHNHKGPVYLYVPVLFLLAAPWGLFLPAALVPRRVAGASDRLVNAFFWGTWIFFTLSASRRSYYLLPILPAVALLVSQLLNAPVETLKPITRRLLNAAYIAKGIGVIFAGSLLLNPADVLPTPYDHLPPLPARPWFAVGWLIALMISGRAILRPQWRPFAALAITAAGLGFGLLVAFPAMDEYRTRRGFAEAVNRATAAEPEKLALYHARDVVFQLARPSALPDFEEPETFQAAARAGAIHWVIVRKRYLPQLAETAMTVVLEEATYSWEGADQLGDKMLLLKIVSKPGE